MVRPAFVGANSSISQSSLASRDSARNHCRVSTLPRRLAALWMKNIAPKVPEGVQAVLELLEGYDLPAAAWNRKCCASGEQLRSALARSTLFHRSSRLGTAQPTQNQNGRPASPVRSSPVSGFRTRESVTLAGALRNASTENAPDTPNVLETLLRKERYSSANSSRKPSAPFSC